MVIKRFKEQVSLLPDKIAIKTNDKSYTYRELDTNSDVLSSVIKKKGDKKRIALLLGHNVETILAMLSVLKIGKAYIPMDNNYPKNRLTYMLEDSQAEMIITNGQNLSLAEEIIKLADQKIGIINIDDIAEYSEPIERYEEVANQELAYILYTSGSTNKPKGIMQTQKNIVHFIDCYRDTLDITSQDRLTLFSSFSHDAAVMDVFGALLCGATLYPLDVKKHTDFNKIYHWLVENNITIWHSVPTFFRYFISSIETTEQLNALRLIVLGGEALLKRDVELYQRLFDATMLYNLYGQTESSFNCGQFISTTEKMDKMVLGQPVSETEIFVVDEDGLEVEPFQEGEILIASSYLSLGYWGDAEGTNKVFSKSDEFGGIYRTGDYGRLLLDGNIEYMGRKDAQIKIRGYRVELGDVESQLLRIDAVKEAVVLANEDKNGEKSLVAYLVMNQEATISTIRTYLADELPDYMIPAHYTVLDKMPLLPNGKTDRKSLCNLTGKSLKVDSDYVAPETHLENLIVALCKEELNIEEVGINDNFFDLGAHSLNIVMINNKLNEQLKMMIPVTQMFEYSTVKKLAEYIERINSGETNESIIGKNQKSIRKNSPKESGDIAVIGMSGRFPGANNIETYWNNLVEGKETVSFFTDDELREMGIEEDVLNNQNYVKAKGVLENVEYFDASFFGYTPKEARMMDPQMRFFHECAWEALEDAGYVSESYEGSIGLYTGASNNLQWQVMNILSEEMGTSESFAARHFFDKDYISTRISYKLNLKGPCYSVQTACSTSLATINMACKDLLLGECDMAMAGGVSIGLPKKSGYMYEKGMILSEDGHCRAFDAKATGTVFGDGIGVVILKRLENAIQDGDNIYAVIKGSATNNDGSRKIGYTAPSIEGQIEVIKAAQEAAGVSAESITYIETHGTGTTFGDPIEIEALKRSFDTDKKGFCAIGSVKTNIGHLNVASGIAGFIKTTLAIKNKKIPPSLHFETPNPKIDFEASPFYVNTKTFDWKNDKFPLRAGISSFGIGGTNTHMILEEAPAVKGFECRKRERIITLSAKTEAALEQITKNLMEDLSNNKDRDIADIAYTLQVGRKNFRHRRSAVVSTIDEAIERLSTLNSKAVCTGEASVVNKNIIFMFTGQGSQYINMGRDLYSNEGIFKTEMDRCFGILNMTLGCDAKAIIYPDKDQVVWHADINETQFTQPLLFSYEYALAKQLMAWGIKPKAMIGHSLGEYVAACIAGVFTLEDALQLVSTRGKLMQNLDRGSMMMVEATEEKLLKKINDDISIAAINGENKIVVSGSEGAINKLREELKDEAYNVSVLITSHAFHSKMMEPIMLEFERELNKVVFNRPTIPFISNLTGTWVLEEEAITPQYWTQHLRQAVRFDQGMKELMKSEQAVFVEVGPGRTLSTFARSNAMKGNGHHVVNLSRHIHEEIADDVYLLDKIGRLWVIGVEVIWAELYSGDTRKRISLPTYPFERDYYWTKDYHLNDLMKKIGNRSNNFVDVRVIEDRNDIETILENDVDKIEVVQEQRYKRPEVSTAYEGPRDEIEGVLADICSEIMEIDKIGIHDDFFELGGDSLGAITLCGKIQSKLKVDITVVDIFQNPTVAEIADFIRETQSTKYLAIEPATEKEYYAASPAQRRLYTLQELDKDNIAYNLPGTFVLEGVIDTDKINGIFVQLIKRHEALRTSFGSVDGEPVQYIHKDGVFELQLYNSTEESLDSLIRDFIKPFDLSEKTLFRAGLIKLANDKHILIIDMHHIVSDGISLSILIKEFTQLYKGKELEPVKIQYKDYSEWLYNTLTKDEQKNFWINQFKGDIPILNLIGDSPRPATKSYEGGRFSLKIDEKLTQRLKTTCKSTDATLYMMLLSAYNVLLAKYSGQEDIIIGSPIVGRHSGDLNDVMGIFVNTLAMRNHPVKEKTFKEFLAQVKKNALGAYENQDYPFEELVKNLNVKRDMSRNPLFDVMFTMLSMTMSTQAIEGLIIKPYVYEYNMSKVDMELLVTEKEACIEIEIVYATKIFNKKTIQRFAAHYEHILNQITENTEVKLSDIQLATAAEKKQIIEVFNDTEADYPKGKTIHQLFQEQVEKTPHHIAVTYEDQSYNYVELNRKANQLARVLVSKGVKTDTIVGIMVERSIEMIVGIMAIVKAGGAYLPIEPVYPIDRIMFMLEDSNATILLTQSWLSDSIKFDGDTLMIDQSSLYVGDEHNLDLEQDAASLAYVIYTSGSTGNPKGVMIQHRSLVNRLNWMQRKFPIGEGDVILQKTPFTFDVSLWEVFWWSMVGASVHMLEPGGEKDPELLVKTIEKRSITTMHFVPSMLSIFLEYVKNNQKSCDLSTLNQVFASGEALLKNQVDLFSTLIESKFGTALINLYGPTEATVDVSYYECRQLNDKQSVPIGRPIDNTRIYITDDSLNLMPIGVPGELCISGDGLARGYINRPELTAERFVNNPYEPNGKMYRTGDLVRWYEDGNIEYLGRLDFQVKIRGYRIELGEIEGRLKEHKSIKDSVVVDLADEGGNKYLCAYIVSEDEVTIQSLKEHLYQDLPQYMIPSYFVHLENLPLSANGKINRKALPEPTHNLETGTVYVAPKNEIQEQILAVWQEILKNDKIGIADDFFTLGGDSFKALNAVSKLNGIISLADIFQYPTIELLWKHVFEAEREISLLNKLTTSNADENGTAIVCVPYGGGSSIIYKPLAEEIDKGGIKTDLYAINLPGHDTSDPGELDTILNIAKKCVEEIKKLIRKPVLLYGHCVGVGLTIEIARLLEEDEYPVIGIGIGAVLPVKSNVFVTPKIDVYESKSDEEVHKFLKSLGGFDYPMEVEELASLMASFRHDVVQMRKYFYTDYAGLNPKKLQAPVYNIIGTEDRLTRGYNKSYKKWMNYAETVNAPIVLEKAGHYFIKSHAKELAESISQIVASNEGKMTATVTAKQSHINCP